MAVMASAVLVGRTSGKLAAACRSASAPGYLEPARCTEASPPARRLAALGATSRQSRPVKASARRAPPSGPIPALLLVAPGNLERHLTPPLAEAQAQGARRDEGAAVGGGGSGGGGSGGVTVTGGTKAAGGAGGTGGSSGAGGASCSNVVPCGGDVVGTWTVTSSCLRVSGQLDMSMLGAGCASAPVEGSLQVTGTWTARSDGTYRDATTTFGSEQITLPASCLVVSSTPVSCGADGLIAAGLRLLHGQLFASRERWMRLRGYRCADRWARPGYPFTRKRAVDTRPRATWSRPTNPRTIRTASRGTE
jgi:hypothetical protein